MEGLENPSSDGAITADRLPALEDLHRPSQSNELGTFLFKRIRSLKRNLRHVEQLEQRVRAHRPQGEIAPTCGIRGADARFMRPWIHRLRWELMRVCVCGLLGQGR